ncbi:MAG: hypothetical protein U0794_11555 [Isosphaeraceae bacterium]
MSADWQQALTVLSIAIAAAYLARRMLRSLSPRSAGSGCGSATGCQGCATRTTQCLQGEGTPPLVVISTIKPRS